MHLYFRLQTTWVGQGFDIEPKLLNYYQPGDQKVCRKFMECCPRRHLKERARVEDVCTMRFICSAIRGRNPIWNVNIICFLPAGFKKYIG